MTFILISGNMNVGKTYVCNKLHSLIGMDKTFTVHNRQKNNVMERYDFFAHYEKDGRHIVLNSPSGKDSSLIETCQYLDSLVQGGVRPDIVITTIRETDDINKKEYPMRRMLARLEAIANGTTNLKAYCASNIAANPISTPFAPTSLVHNVFVLHLEQQQVSGSKEEKNNALAQYADGKAETAKQMLNLALIRL